MIKKRKERRCEAKLTRCCKLYPHQSCEFSPTAVESHHSICRLRRDAVFPGDGEFSNGNSCRGIGLAFDGLDIFEGCVLDLGFRDVVVGVIIVFPDEGCAGGVDDDDVVEDDADAARRGEDLVGALFEEVGCEFRETEGLKS